MSTLDDDMVLMREQLVAALHDELKDALDIARITRAVDVAIETAAVRTLLDTAATGSLAITEYATAFPTPPPAVVAAQAVFDSNAANSRDFYASIP